MAVLEAERGKAKSVNYKIIDVDTHLSEPEDLWTSRAPAKFKDRVPQVAIVDGEPSWVIDGKHKVGLGASSFFHKSGKVATGIEYVNWRIADVLPSCYDTKARLAHMDEAGIYAQILYPNVIGFGGQNTGKVDPELRLVSIQIYNDFMAELQEQSGQRLLPMTALPWWDIDLAVKETVRMADAGLHGININSDPHLHITADGTPLPDLSHDYWAPLWELCQDRDIPINFHIGASEQSMKLVDSAPWPSLKGGMMAALVGSMLFIDNSRVMANIIFSGMLDRFPKLKFVSVESGLGWVPFMLESLDYQYNYLTDRPNFDLTPSEYFKRNFYACFWFEKRDLSHLIERIGVDNCMFETDFPHPVSLHPEPLDYIESGLAQLSDDARQKVMSGNASRVYNIPV
jgi:predicted TIM-barrel fold metal-dependent hydrolase